MAKILIACEFSGRVRDEFTKLGHYAMSCDNEHDTETEGPHYMGDVRDVLDEGWDLMVAHPPCQYIASSGLHWNNRIEGRAEKTTAALDFVKLLWEAPIPRVAIENPVGCINTRLSFMPKPQYIQPYEFGDDASKKTGIWTRNLPRLEVFPEDYVEPRIVERNGKQYKRWGNQLDCGRDDTPKCKDRPKMRSRTWPGIANAIAVQWSIALDIEKKLLTF